MRHLLTFDEVVSALEESSFTICMPPHGTHLVVEYLGWEDCCQDDDAPVGYVMAPSGWDDVRLAPTDKFEVTLDGTGFMVPGCELLIYPNKAFNFKEKK